MKRQLRTFLITSALAVAACIGAFGQNQPARGKANGMWEGSFTEAGRQQVVMQRNGNFYIADAREDGEPTWQFLGSATGLDLQPENLYTGEFGADGKLSFAHYSESMQRWFYGRLTGSQLIWEPAGDADMFQAVEGGPVLFSPKRDVSEKTDTRSARSEATGQANFLGIAPPAVGRYPIRASRRDNLPGTGLTMSTNVTIEANGLLTATTRTTQATLLRGATGGVGIVLMRGETILWASRTMAFGVDGRWIGRWDRTDTWTDRVPLQVLQQADGVAIRHFHAPKSAAVLFSEWLRWVSANIGAIIAIVTAILG